MPDNRPDYLAEKAFPKLSKRIRAHLWKQGFRTAEQVELATDAELMELSGVDTGSLYAIRKFYPARTLE